MIVGKIKVNGRELETNDTFLGYRFSENLQIQVEFTGNTYDGYTLLWYFSNDHAMNKTGGLVYDKVTKRITLTEEAFYEAGDILISMRAVKDSEVITTDYVIFHISTSANPDMDSLKRDPNWEKTAVGLIEEVFQKEYKAKMDKLFEEADMKLVELAETAEIKVNEALKEVGDIVSAFDELKHRTPYVYDTEADLINADDIPAGSYAFTFGKDDVDDGGSKAWVVTTLEDAPVAEEQFTLLNGMVASKMGYFGGGGGGSALPTLTSDFVIDSCKKDEIIEIPFFFQSPNIGRGTVHMSINGAEIKTETIKVGGNIIATPPMAKGRNVIKIYVIDAANLPSNELTWTIQCGALEVSSSFNADKDYMVGDTIRFVYNVDSVTDESITTHYKLDGISKTMNAVKGYNTFDLISLGAGVHDFELYVSTDTMTSNTLKYNIIVLDSDSLYVSTTFIDTTIEEGNRVAFDYRISMKGVTEFDVSYLVNGTVTKRVTGQNGQNYMILNDLTEGAYIIGVNVATKDGAHTDGVTRNITVTPSQYQKIDPVTNGLLAWYRMSDGDNAASDRNILKDRSGNNHHGTLYNYNYSTNGYIDGALKCNGIAYAEIPLRPFENNAEYGLTIDIQFAMRDIGDSEAKVIYCRDDNDPNVGIEINTLNASLSSIKQSLQTVISNDAKTRITYVIDRDSKIMSIYVNAVRCEIGQLSDIGNVLESFATAESIMLNGCVDPVTGEIIHQGNCEIYNMRIYNRALSYDDVLQNHISDIDNRKEQQDKYNMNYNDSMSTLYFTGDMSGMSKDDAKEIAIRYMPSGGEYGQAFDLKKCKVTFQGTSSLQYPVKNYKIKLYDDFGAKYKYSPFGDDTIKESTFTLKADMMSSAHFENTGCARMINDAPYKELTPAKAADDRVRHTINGFPIQLIVNGEFAGVYNFNNDKGNTDTFGFDFDVFPNCLSYEVAANSDTTAGAFCKWTPETGISELEYLQTDFELRYPDEDDVGADHGYLISLKRLVDWVSDATDAEFKAHLHEYMNVEYTIFYYLQVFVFGMVDNLGKNMMLSTWDGKIWYPQFYDLDTQIGLSNTGRISFDSDIEMEAGTFNTSASRLWTKLQRNFDAEIKARYAELRADYFTMDNIMKYLYDDIVALIGERQYNMDSEAKYVNNKQYLFMAHGNRLEFAKRWLEERILYLDSKLDYTEQTGKSITIRVNKKGEVHFDLKTYSPQYVKVRWRNNSEEIRRIGRDETVRFTYNMPTATDQEVLIYNAPFIKSLGDLSSMAPTEILIENASKLTELICTGANALGSITLPVNSFVQRIDLNGCSNLGKGQGGTTGMSVLNIAECENLKYLDARDTSLTSIIANPFGGNLQYIFYPWSIQEIDLRKQYALKAAIIPFTSEPIRYSAVTSVTMIDCPLLCAMTSVGDIYKVMTPITKAINVMIRNTGFPDMEYNSTDAKEYGVRKLIGSLSADWERCLKIGNVTWYGKDTNLEANMPFENEVVRNDFDDIAPWSKIKTVEISGRIMTEFPKFYVKHVKEDGYEYWWISESMKAGYHLTHPFAKADGTEYSRFLMARYLASGENFDQSMSGGNPNLTKNREQVIENALNIGTGWHITMYDEYTDLLYPLFLVEFATANSQNIASGLSLNGSVTKIGYSATDITNEACVYVQSLTKSIKQNMMIYFTLSGIRYNPRVVSIETATDTGKKMTRINFDEPVTIPKDTELYINYRDNCTGITHFIKGMSGKTTIVDNYTRIEPFIYRGLENIWGGYPLMLMNMARLNDETYCCDFYTNYKSDAEFKLDQSGYHKIGSNIIGYISDYEINENRPWLLYPNEVNGTTSTGYCDHVLIESERIIVCVGSDDTKMTDSNGGLFAIATLRSNDFVTRLSLSID